MKQQLSQDRGESSEGYLQELLHRANADGDLKAWTELEHSLQATVLAWLLVHPARAVVCAEQDEQSFVEEVFAEAWQAVRQGQLACDSLRQVQLLLRASLNGAMLEAQWVSTRANLMGEELPTGRDREGHRHSQNVRRWLLARLSDEREQRLAYLLYHCGLQPTEMVQGSPQEWSDIQEVLHLRHVIFTHFQRELEP